MRTLVHQMMIVGLVNVRTSEEEEQRGRRSKGEESEGRKREEKGREDKIRGRNGSEGSN